LERTEIKKIYMGEDEKIETVFEFITKGAKETEASMNALFATQIKLQKIIKETEVIYSDQGKAMDKLTAKHADLSKKIDSGNKSSREEFVKTKEAIKEVGSAMDTTKKSIDQANETYSKLSGGIGTVNASIKEMKDAQKALTKEFENVKVGSDEYKKLGTQLGTIKKSIKEVGDANKDLGKSSTLVVGSVEELRKKYSDLSKEWKKTKIDSPEFAEQTKQLNAYNEELKKVEGSIGVYSRSVGDYKLAAQGFNDQLRAMAPNLSSTIAPLGGVVKGFKALSVTPVIGILALIIGAFDYLKNIMSKTEKGQDDLNVAMAGFGGIVEAVISLVVNLTKGFFEMVSSFDKLGEGLKNIFIGMRNYLNFIKDLATGAGLAIIGIFSDEAKKKSDEYFESARRNFNEQTKFLQAINEKRLEGVKIGELENKLRKDAIKNTVLLAKNEAERAELEVKAYDKSTFSLKTRTEFLIKAGELEKQNLDARIKRAEEELELAKMKTAIGETTIENLEEEAKAEANLFNIRKEYNNQLKGIAKKLSAFKQQEIDEEAKAQKLINDNYTKSLNERQRAEEELLKAQISRDEKQIELSQKVLDIRNRIFEDYAKENIKLTEEEKLSIEILEYDHIKKIEGMKDAEASRVNDLFEKERQKAIDDFTKFSADLYNLEQRFKESKNVEERKYLTGKIDETKALVKNQVDVLKQYQVEASQIPIVYAQAFNKNQESIVQGLSKSLQTIKEFSGDALGEFGNLSTSMSGLIGTAFELANVKEKWGDDLEGMKADVERLNADISTMALASSANLNKGVSSIISSNFTQQIDASKKFYEDQAKSQEKSFDAEKKQLDKKLKDSGISQGKYEIEKFKLEEKQDKARLELKKKEANEIHEIQLKQFRAKKAQDAISAGIGLALGIVNAWINPITAPFTIPIIATAGALGIASILSAPDPPKPSFKQGGYLDKGGIIRGNSHEQGGVPISVGGQVVAEAEGTEGALFMSKKSMADPEARALFKAAHARNEEISGKNPNASSFEQGGYLDLEHFRNISKNNAHQAYQKEKKKWGFFAKKKSEKNIEGDAKNLYNNYRDEQIGLLDAQEKEAENIVNQGISSNETLQAQGVGSIGEYNQKVSSSEKTKKDLEEKISAERDYSDAKIDLIKQQLGYEQKLEDFDNRKKEAQKDLSATTLALDKKNLEELRRSNKITEEEYALMLDQIVKGYGIKTQDIINLKKQEVEEKKKLINKERDEEISAIKETSDFQKQALNEIRQNWKKDYAELTKDAIKNIENASEYIDKLTGKDLERYKSILKITDDIKKLEDDYKKNEGILTDGVIVSREETKKLIEEQKRIKEELAVKAKEAEEEKKKFEEQRKESEKQALKDYEKENFQAILAQIKEQGAGLQAEASKWTIDKELAKEFETQLAGINSVYDEQIKQQDKIISNLDLEYKQAQLLHDQKIANIKAEEEALKNSFETQRKKVEDEYKKATQNMTADLTNLNATLLAIKQAGAQAGIAQYENTLQNIASNLNNLPKFAEGGAISIGTGVFKAYGDTDKGSGKGVNMSIGGIPIAKIGGGENVIITNEGASNDPRMTKAISEISAINNYYNTGTPVPQEVGEKLDYDLLADKLAGTLSKVISRRPVHAYITGSEIEKSARNNQLFRRNSSMR